jgi:hypothetical protein
LRSPPRGNSSPIPQSRDYDPVFAARPLKRVIQHRILDPLSLELLSGTFREGDSVTVDVDAGKLAFRAEKMAKEVASEKKEGRKNAKRST